MPWPAVTMRMVDTCRGGALTSDMQQPTHHITSSRLLWSTLVSLKKGKIRVGRQDSKDKPGWVQAPRSLTMSVTLDKCHKVSRPQLPRREKWVEQPDGQLVDAVRFASTGGAACGLAGPLFLDQPLPKAGIQVLTKYFSKKKVKATSPRLGV